MYFKNVENILFCYCGGKINIREVRFSACLSRLSNAAFPGHILLPSASSRLIYVQEATWINTFFGDNECHILVNIYSI